MRYLLPGQRRAAQAIKNKEDEIGNLKKQLSKMDEKLARSQKAYEHKKEKAMRIMEENSQNDIWNQMLRVESVHKTFEYYTYFASLSWNDFDLIKTNVLSDEFREEQKGGVILIGNPQACQDYYDRYGSKDTISLNPDTESWSSMQEVFEYIGLEN